MPYTVREQTIRWRHISLNAVRYVVLLDDDEPIAYTHNWEDAQLIMNVLNDSAEERIDGTVDNIPYAGESA